ncbi:MAG TPA: hypothetical protein VH637_07105 [Streptosporangiaceae bacterium]|jgi:hypothetical protein
MWAGAVIEAILFVIGVATISSAKSALRTSNPKLTGSEISAAVNFQLGFVALAVLLWVLCALGVRRGQSWARMTGTVLFAIYTLLILLEVSRLSVGVGVLIYLVVWLVGLGSVILLWRKDASAFFKPQPQL